MTQMLADPSTTQTQAMTLKQGSTSANGTVHSVSPQQIEYVDGTESDVDDAAYLLMRAFEETMGQIFPNGCTRDLHTFRQSQIKQSLAAMQAYKQGTYSSPTRFAVARMRPSHASSITHADLSEQRKRSVIGMVMWSLEGVASPQAIQQSTFVPPPFGPYPEGANVKLFQQFRAGMAESEAKVMGNKPHASVKYICVDPDVRRSGAGTGLMKLVRADALHAGNLPIYLDAAETSSAPSFYKKLGFNVVGRVQPQGLDTGTQAMLLYGDAPAPLLDQ